MGIGLALTVHLSQQFPSSVWLFAGGLAHAKFRLAAAQFWPRHARHRAHRHEGLAMPIAVVLGVIGLSWIPRNQLWVVCAALVLAAAFVAVRAVRCAQLDRARMRQHALQFLNSKISRPCSGASGADYKAHKATSNSMPGRSLAASRAAMTDIKTLFRPKLEA
jgi:hypothetical protein